MVEYCMSVPIYSKSLKHKKDLHLPIHGLFIVCTAQCVYIHHTHRGDCGGIGYPHHFTIKTFLNSHFYRG